MSSSAIRSSIAKSVVASTISVRRSSPYASAAGHDVLLDHGEHLRAALEDALERRDELDDLLVLVLDLLPLESGEALEPHVEDRLRLDLRELERLHQLDARVVDVLRLLDELDDLVDVVERDLEPLEDVRPLLGLRQVELRPPDDDLLAVRDEVLDHLLQRHDLRHAVDERQQDRRRTSSASACACRAGSG